MSADFWQHNLKLCSVKFFVTVGTFLWMNLAHKWRRTGNESHEHTPFMNSWHSSGLKEQFTTGLCSWQFSEFDFKHSKKSMCFRTNQQNQKHFIFTQTTDWSHSIALVSCAAVFLGFFSDVWRCFDMQEAARCQTSNTFPLSSIPNKTLWKGDKKSMKLRSEGVCVCVVLPLWWSVCRSCCRSLISARIWGHGVSHSAPSLGFYLLLLELDLELWTTDRERDTPSYICFISKYT